MFSIIRYLITFIYVISCLNSFIDCDHNLTYSRKWPFDYQINKQLNEINQSNQIESQNNHQIEKPNLSSNLPSLINLYKDYKNNFIVIDDDLKYNRENQNESIEQFKSDTKLSNSTEVINKSDSELKHPTIEPIVPIIKRMLRRKDIRKEYPNHHEFKRRKGYGTSSNYNDETTRSSSNKVYNDDDDDNHSYSSEGDDEDDDSYYEDDNNYGKKSLNTHSNGWSSAAPLATLPLNDHYITGSTGVPSFWNHGHYYPYYANHWNHWSHPPPIHPGHGHYVSKYGKHFYREEYAIILVVISLAAFLGLIFSLFMPYALIQSQALTGVPGNSVPYTNAVTTLNGNQFSNAAVSSDVNRIPISVYGNGRRKKRMIKYNANQYLIRQLSLKNGNSRVKKTDESHVLSFDKLFNEIFIPNFYSNLIYNNNPFNHHLIELATQTTYNILNNL